MWERGRDAEEARGKRRERETWRGQATEKKENNREKGKEKRGGREQRTTNKVVSKPRHKTIPQTSSTNSPK